MTTNLPRLLVLVSIVSYLTGCAFTKETVKLNFQTPSFPDKVKVDTLVSVQKFKDVRGSDPFLLANAKLT